MNALCPVFGCDVLVLVISIIFCSLNAPGYRTRYFKCSSVLVHWSKCLRKTIFSIFAPDTDLLNSFVPNVHFLYHLKTSENLKVFRGRESVHWEQMG